MPRFRALVWFAVILAVQTCLTGCGSAPEKPEFAKNLVPVTGTVTWEGGPLAGATVRYFAAANATSGETADAITDAEGKYTLLTQLANASIEDRKGAVPGTYQVVVSKIVMPDGSNLPPGMTEADALAENAKELIPAKYSNPETTILRETVKPEPNVINFELVP